MFRSYSTRYSAWLLLTAAGLSMLWLQTSCEPGEVSQDQYLFKKINLQSASVDFINELSYTEEVNVYTFRNFYNGAGVGLADFNRDGLVDLFFCGNQVDNQLYLNKGSFRFENITESANVASENVWTTGVSIADVNGDGWLDIYTSKSGEITGDKRYNELFINRGINGDIAGLPMISFDEKAREYGLDDIGLSTHAAFFDYDLDGDLDCYLLNNSYRSVGNYDLRPGQREVRDVEGGNKLYRNDGEVFTDVSEQAGIYGSAIGFGLGVTLGDVNQDGWPDIYVSNDFFEKDYLYLNQGNGTFVESIEDRTGEISMGSMGADLADINNDGFPEIFVTEMLPKEERRAKSKAQFENWNKYQANIDNGYFRQFGRNVLQLNTGDGHFVEIGRLSGVEATDWSWGALIFDMNNDGLKDIFVANGIYKDLLDQDFVNFFANPDEVRKIIFDKEGGLDKLVDLIPSEPIRNFAFQNMGNLQFTDQTSAWGLDEPSFSNGSAYGDLDNDGDLDLVVSNVNMPPFIFENQTNQKGEDFHFLQISLRDTLSKNTGAIGTKIYLYTETGLQFAELYPARGFMSSVDSRLHFGLPSGNLIDSVLIIWPDRKKTLIRSIQPNQHLEIHKPPEADKMIDLMPDQTALFKQIKGVENLYRHDENDYSDFDREPLLLGMNSNEGPACCTGDINGDGLADVFLGGAHGQAGQLLVQTDIGVFKKLRVRVLNENKNSEQVDCIFFDANGDGWEDLYVASGSTEFGPNSSNNIDYLYLNERGRNFSQSSQVLPTFTFENTSSVDVLDYDRDGDLDLVVGNAGKSYAFGIPGNLYLLENDGEGYFANVTDQLASEFLNLGMISDVRASDWDGDGDDDIIVAGRWMGINLFQNNQGTFKKQTIPLLDSLRGLWNNIEIADVDSDGDDDYVLGNHGLNSRLKASDKFPLYMYVNDFDQNGRPEQIFCYSNEEGVFPFTQRNDLLRQLPYLSKKYPDFNSYAAQSVDQIFTPEQLSSALSFKITELKSGVLRNLGDGQFLFEGLPLEAQLSPVYSTLTMDMNGDEKPDMMLGGNQFRMKPEIGINAGNWGLFMKGLDKGKFNPVPSAQSGIFIRGEVRQIVSIDSKSDTMILFALNDNSPLIFQYVP